MRKANRVLTGLALAAGMFIAPQSRAAQAQLGDPAAPLKIAEWIKGKPVTLAEGRGKKVYVIEFWATWCPPCRRSIPHLTELRKKYGPQGVVFIGISTEKASVVRPFVKRMGDQMDYLVAVDQDRQTSKAYMAAYGQNGIPTAFVIDKQGKVVWVGHPMAGLEETLKAVLAGRYNIENAALRAEGMKLLRQFFQQSQSDAADEAALRKLAEQIEEVDRKVGGLMPGQQATVATLMEQAAIGRWLGRYQKAVFSGQSEAELAALERKVRAHLPANVNFDQLKQQLKQQKLLRDYLSAATKGDAERAQALGPTALRELKSAPVLLNQLAWVVLTDNSIKYRDRKFALEVAKAAVDASHERDANILDTYARALWDNGQRQEAIAWQKKAVELVPQAARPSFQKTLEKYQKAKTQ